MDFFTFTEEFHNGKLDFLCSFSWIPVPRFCRAHQCSSDHENLEEPEYSNYCHSNELCILLVATFLDQESDQLDKVKKTNISILDMNIYGYIWTSLYSLLCIFCIFSLKFLLHIIWYYLNIMIIAGWFKFGTKCSFNKSFEVQW